MPGDEGSTRPSSMVDERVPTTATAPNATWEAKDFHCPVCFGLFSDDENHDTYPFFVCGNHHTLCRNCLASVLLSDHPACPECRQEIGSAASSANRLVLQFMQQLKLPCGSCRSPALLSLSEIHRHLQECPQVTITCPMTTRDHVGRDMVCGQRICCADLWEHCQQVHTNSAPQPAAYDDGVLTLTATITATSPAIFFFVSLHDATRHQWALHASLDPQGNLVTAVRRFGTCPEIKNSTFAIDSGDRKLDNRECKTSLRSFGAVMRGPRVLGPHEAVTAAHILVPQALLAAMRPTGTALRLELAVELEFEQKSIA